MTPSDLASAVALGATGFVATSGDNFILLLGLYGNERYRARDVLAGYVGAVALVVVTSRLLGLAAHQAPPGILGYLGAIPIALGTWHLLQLARSRTSAHGAFRPPASASGALAVGLVTLAASGDSLATFAAIFADTRPPLGLLILGVSLACALATGMLARRLVHETGLGARVSRVAPYVLPFLLIGIGVFIVADTPIDMVN